MQVDPLCLDAVDEYAARRRDHPEQGQCLSPQYTASRWTEWTRRRSPPEAFLALTRVDLPLPVLPTIPTFSPLLIVTSRLSRTVGPSSEYLADSLSSTISPEVGHDAGGSFSGTELGSWSITR
jgi:hypothetical protein